MVATRQSAAAANASVNKPEAEKTSPGIKEPSPRKSARRQLNEELRQKSTGVGVISAAPQNKKIIFDDEIAPVENDEEKLGESAIEEKDVDNGNVDDDDGEDDDDDAVEEVKGSAAKEAAMDQREQERATARAAAVGQTRKRKKKVLPAVTEELDEDFFAQLEEERRLEKKQRTAAKKKAKQKQEPTGQHTTFVVSGDDPIDTKPQQENHNIEVVVLDTTAESATGRSLLLETKREAPSKDVLIYSRSLLVDGSEEPSAKQLQKQKKSGHKTAQAPTWKRSKKMARITGPRRKACNKAAAVFVVKMT